MTKPKDEGAAAGRHATDEPPTDGTEMAPESPPGQPCRPIPDQRSSASASLVTTEHAGPLPSGGWSPGASVAARRRIAGLPGRWIDPGTKGMVVAGDGHGRCTVRFHTGAIIAGLDGRDVVVIPNTMRC
jgi:hypothetical protein